MRLVGIGRTGVFGGAVDRVGRRIVTGADEELVEVSYRSEGKEVSYVDSKSIGGGGGVDGEKRDSVVISRRALLVSCTGGIGK